MDSWTLQGESYSFLRSAPRNVPVCRRDGTPNHVEIFDIINNSNQQSAISETTCLCDIFGDDCESPSLPSSPAAESFVPSQIDVDGHSVVSSPLDELNNSSGSYHTAPGSIEGEEGFDKSTEGHLDRPSPVLGLTEENGMISEQQEVVEEGVTNTNRKSPYQKISTPSSLSGDTGSICGERTPPPGHNCSPCPSSARTLSSLSSSSVEKRESPSFPFKVPTQSESEEETLAERPNSQFSQSPLATGNTSPTIKTIKDITAICVSPEPRVTTSNEINNSPNQFTSIGSTIDIKLSAEEVLGHLPSPLPSSEHSEGWSESRDGLITPQGSSTTPEPSGRVSLPDLFSRGSTPETESSSHDQDLISHSRTSSENNLDLPVTSTHSTPAPRYTPPSPVTSLNSSPAPWHSSVSPGIKDIYPSFEIPSNFSPGEKSPSPRCLSENSDILSSSDHRNQPLLAHNSLSPSPEIKGHCSPKEQNFPNPSPEIRITSSSPEVFDREITPALPFVQPHFESERSRIFNSSPHITGISYSVIQPEDRDSPPFPELDNFSSQEFDNTQQSFDDGTLSPASLDRSSIHSLSDRTVSSYNSHSEEALSHLFTYQTPSPQHQNSPEPQNQSSPFNTKGSPLVQLNSREQSPIVSSPTHRDHRLKNISRDSSPDPSNPCLVQSTRFEEIQQITEQHITENTVKSSVSPVIGIDLKERSFEIEELYAVPVVQSSEPSSEEESKRSFNTEEQLTQTQTNAHQDTILRSSSGNKIHSSPLNIQKESSTKHLSDTPPDLQFCERENLTAHKAKPEKTVQILGNQLPPFISYPLKPVNDPVSNCVTKNSLKQTSPKFQCEISSSPEDMAHHVNRRRTPSPPITRFTPVHIIAPEKPYRQWQNSRCTGAEASVQSSRPKTPESYGENPAGSNSHPQWVRLERQFERERKLQLEDMGETVGVRQGEMKRETKREGKELKKGEEWQGHMGYRGEQVDLSFNARNRKGFASRKTALTSRETRQRLPTAHSYAESLLATRQLQQQQNLHRSAPQQDTKVGGPGRRLNPPGLPGKDSPQEVTSRPCQSSSSSMGSEFDDADSEVNWLTDVAFSSLSSPEVDYLDMYNSSHRSSTNISQPSTQESPAGVNAASLAYADFSGTGSNLEYDDFSFQQPLLHCSDGLESSRRYEMGSFECIDVAMEREDLRKKRRGVPKRQIQLKRKESREEEEGQDESSERSMPVSQELLLRQHTTPMGRQDFFLSGHNTEPRTHRHNQLKNSTSPDETYTKSKMATCLIKNVLSKKMQDFDQQPDEELERASSPDSKTPLLASAGSSFKETSLLHSDDNLSCEDLRGEYRTHVVQTSKTSGGISSDRPSSTGSNRSNRSSSLSKNSEPFLDLALGPKIPHINKKSGAEIEDLPNSSKHLMEAEGDDSTHVSATGDAVMQPTQDKRDQDNENREDRKQQGGKSPCLSKSQTSAAKRKTSLNVRLTPETEIKLEDVSKDMSFEKENNKAEMDVDPNAVDREKKAKSPIHKVRDVRRLVKNTYNLSFKATSSLIPKEVSEYFNDDRRETTENEGKISSELKGEKGQKSTNENERKEKLCVIEQTPPILSQAIKREGKPHSHLQIQCRAVCLKGNKDKTLDKREQKEGAQTTETLKNNLTGIGTIPAKSCQGDVGAKGSITNTDGSKMSNKEDFNDAKSHGNKKTPLLGSIPKQPSKEREVSTAVVLIRDGSNKTKVSPSPEQEVTNSQRVSDMLPTTSGSGHSVSMLLKEKGYQADIGAVVGNGSDVEGGKGVLPKHVNCLEIPLQPTVTSDKSQKDNSTGSPETYDNSGTAKLNEGEADEGTQIKQKKQDDFEEVKKQDSSFPPRSPRKVRQQPIEVKSLSNESHKQEMTTNIKSNRPQTIEVKSIAKTSQKPIVPPKPTCKFKPADLGAFTNEANKPINNTKSQGEERSQTIVVSSPTIYRKISNESMPTQSYTRKLAVSAVSSLKPPTSKKAVSTTCNVARQQDTEGPSDTNGQDSSGLPPQISRTTKSSSALPPTSESTTGQNKSLAATGSVDLMEDQTPEHPSAPVRKESQLGVFDPEPPLQYPKSVYSNESLTSDTPKQHTSQAPRYPQQQLRRSLSSERPKRIDDHHYYSSGDPPSYDERESFSPLMLPDLTPRRFNRFQTSSRPPPCSCTTSCPHHPGPAPPTHHRSPHNLTPPAPSHSPGQILPYQITQAPPRTHQYRGDPQSIGFQASSSPKSSPLGPTQSATMYQPPSFPPQASIMPTDRQMPPIDPRRHYVHRSPQQQSSVISGAPYSDTGHGHSPSLPPLDPQYLCGPQSLGHSYGSDYGGDNSSMYSESSYGHAPRRVLLDPETGKYFYIEVPMQPLRKMLFDPETGQYVEVVIPQQAMSHSGLYPPSAAPYPSMHNPNMYAPSSQYMPYTAPPPPPHPQTQIHPPRYPEASAATAMNPNSQSVNYRNSTGPASKPENQNHPTLDQGYLESMYYDPTGMTASPNTTPSVYYHKHPPSIPPTGGKRS